MASSAPQARYPTSQYPSTHFVESAGTVLFHLSTKRIAILLQHNNQQYVLPKGRVNQGETRQVAAARESTEETGYPCRLLPLNMETRAPPPVEEEQLDDIPRRYVGVTEPFMLQVRQFKGGVKLVWWFVAVVEEEKTAVQEELDKSWYTLEMVVWDEAVEKLTFEVDKEVVRKAIALVTETYGETPTYGAVSSLS